MAKTNLKSVTSSSTMEKNWQSIDWKAVLEFVRTLRGKIFLARKNGDMVKLKRYQQLMLRSKANILVSIRKVTSINIGKRTPGLDKMLVKTNEARWKLYESLIPLKEKDWITIAKPVKRIYIPKKNGKLRPLGIPNIKDRVIQNIVKNALEPDWEAQFENSSYGFRPKRGCADAIQRIWVSTARHKKRLWVLDADIKGCFDNIDHQALLDKLGDFPAKKVIEVWLKAGYVEFPKKDVIETTKGTPQGGAISPLLANIALHGIESALGIQVYKSGYNNSNNSFSFIRYADDFVVLASSKEECERAKTIVEGFLTKIGLEFAPEKVHIRHLSEGFKFLGTQIRLMGIKNQKVILSPHKDSILNIKEKIRETWLKNKASAPEVVIPKLNAIVRGWANYHRTNCSSDVFSALDNWMFTRTWRYAIRRHPMKGKKWVKVKYFTTPPEKVTKIPKKKATAQNPRISTNSTRPLKAEQKSNHSRKRNDWHFFGTTKGGTKIFLLKFAQFKIEYHTMVKNNMVPDDPSPEAQEYWEKRDALKQFAKWGSYESRLKLAKKQYHLCPICYQSLYNEEELHVHHIIPKKKGGKDSYGNLVILHELCHRQAHSIGIEPQEMRTKLMVLRKLMKHKLARPMGDQLAKTGDISSEDDIKIVGGVVWERFD